MKKQILIRFLALIVLLAMALTACGEADTPEVDTTSDTNSVPEQAVDIPTQESIVPGQAAPEEAGTIVSDMGFRPQENGFSFSNYGDDLQVSNLTSVELRRMFGDQVCARLEGEECVLTPPAQQWMEQINGDMSGGHCEGMAALSLLMYSDQVKETDFGGSLATDLDINNPDLQREIAYWWTTQAVDPTAGSVIKGTPVEILNVLKEMQPNSESYTIGIYKEDGSGGHAITPYDVVDKGNGVFAVMVYDNNYPGEGRELLVDTHENSWSYEASINPQVESELYAGNADTMTLDLTPTSARLGQQQCPFCEESLASIGGGKLADLAQTHNQIFLDGEGHLLITDESGHRLGYVDGKLVNEIPGAQYTLYRMGVGVDAPEPLYEIPAGMNVTITIDGSALKEETATDLVMIGPGFSIGVEGIGLVPGQVDTAWFYPAEQTISYETSSDESPNIVIGVENPGGEADYYFEAQGTDMVGGGTITAMLDSKAGDLVINTEKLNSEGTFDFYMTRITDKSDEEFSAEQIALKEGALVYINYGEWTNASPNGIYFGVDLNGDGTIDDEYVVDDAVQ